MADPIIQRLGRRVWGLVSRLAGTRVREISFSLAELQAGGFSSQDGQDKFLIEEVFCGKRNGVFVDIGAHDGVSFSNTNVLEKHWGWKGVAVEPVGKAFEKLKANRRCLAIQACVAGRAGTVEFIEVDGYSEMLSGMVSSFDPRHLERMEREVAEHGGTVTRQTVPCLSLDDVLCRSGYSEFDYLSVDVEGAERDVLQIETLRKWPVKVISAENNFGESALRGHMRRAGYRLLARVGADDIYQRR